MTPQRMRNLIAVYSPETGISTARLARIGAEVGYSIRFVKFGGYVHAESFRGNDTALACLGQDYLLCGWLQPGGEEAVAFDAACFAADRDTVVKLMKGPAIRWFELYTHHFDHDNSYAHTPKYQSKIDEAANPAALPVIKSAKSRYIFHNRGRTKLTGVFMLAIATGLATAVNGVLVDHIRPGR